MTIAYPFAAAAEIAGCYASWTRLRLGRSPLWLIPGSASLLLFAWLLTLAPPAAAGRAYAVYGGACIACSLLWLWSIEGVRPDQWDLIGALVCLIGVSIILLGPRTT